MNVSVSVVDCGISCFQVGRRQSVDKQGGKDRQGRSFLLPISLPVAPSLNEMSPDISE